MLHLWQKLTHRCATQDKFQISFKIPTFPSSHRPTERKSLSKRRKQALHHRCQNNIIARSSPLTTKFAFCIQKAPWELECLVFKPSGSKLSCNGVKVVNLIDEGLVDFVQGVGHVGEWRDNLERILPRLGPHVAEPRLNQNFWNCWFQQSRLKTNELQVDYLQVASTVWCVSAKFVHAMYLSVIKLTQLICAPNFELVNNQLAVSAVIDHKTSSFSALKYSKDRSEKL